MNKAIGIDLGTTRSVSAVIEEGRPRLLTPAGASGGIPSVVAVDDEGRTLVGAEAIRQGVLHPGSAAWATKRLLGKSAAPTEAEGVFTYELMEREASELLVRLQGRVFSLEGVSAAILRHLDALAREALAEPPAGAVLTVPAYFSERQRQSVRRAGDLAGIEVLGLLNEPTAVALAHGLGQRLEERVFVYDLGGGTLDLSVIDIADQVYEVIALGGDTFLGGIDFDDRILHLLLESLREGETTRSDWGTLQRLRELSERAKIALSTEESVRIQDTTLGLDYRLTREELEAQVSDLVERTLEVCESVLLDAGIRPREIDRLLLVGGQSRMPLVKERVLEFLGLPVSTQVDPDGAVATGAAVLAWSIHSLPSEGADLRDLLSMGVGIAQPDGRVHPLFAKGASLPASETLNLTTSRENQPNILLALCQGESARVEENQPLGTFTFSGLRPAPAGEVQLEVHFQADPGGLLTLTARDLQTDAQVACELRYEEEIEAPEPEPEPEPAQASPPPLVMPRPTLAGEPPSPEEIAARIAEQQVLPGDSRPYAFWHRWAERFVEHFRGLLGL